VSSNRNARESAAIIGGGRAQGRKEQKRVVHFKTDGRKKGIERVKKALRQTRERIARTKGGKLKPIWKNRTRGNVSRGEKAVFGGASLFRPSILRVKARKRQEASEQERG